MRFWIKLKSEWIKNLKFSGQTLWDLPSEVLLYHGIVLVPNDIPINHCSKQDSTIFSPCNFLSFIFTFACSCSTWKTSIKQRQLINAIVSPTLTSSQVYMPPPVRWRLSRLKLWCLMGALSQSSAVPSLRRRNSSAWRPHTEKSLTEPKMLPGLLNRWTPGKLWQGASLTIYSAVIALLNSVQNPYPSLYTVSPFPTHVATMDRTHHLHSFFHHKLLFILIQQNTHRM